VKNLKILIMLCGAGLLVMMLTDGIGAKFESDKVDALIMLAAFALPTAMGLMGLMKPPFLAWQAAISLAGFAVAAVRTKIWETLPKFMDQDGKGKGALILLVVGVLVSALALMKPEDKS
jgi:phosphoglycerol transferase MdoB-like AlkP superfamily enzyme